MSKPRMQPVKPAGREVARYRDEHDGRDRKHRSPLTFDLIPGTRVDEYAGPYLVGLVLLPVLGSLAHKYWHGALAAFFSVLITGGCAALLWWAEEDMAARKPLVRVRVRASIVAVCMSVVVSTWAGPFTRPWLDVQIVVTAFLCGTWTIATTRAVRGDGTDDHARDTLAEQLGIGRDVSAKKIEEGDGRRVYRLFHPSNTPVQITKALDMLTVKFGTRNVRITPDPTAPDDPRRSVLTVVEGNPLSEPVRWPGPSAAGKSVAMPCRVGVRADGKPLEILRPGDPEIPRACNMVLLAGMPGAGKTNFAEVELAELVTRRDVWICWVDTDKWNAIRRVIGPAIGWPATTIDEAREMILALIRLVDIRVDLFASWGYSEWVPEIYEKYGVPFIVAQFEEFGQVAALLESEFQHAVQAVRSSGISIGASQQRNSATNVSTDIRNLFGINVCHGVRTHQDTVMMLSTETLEAGAAPEVWGTRHPGRVFVEASHIDPTEWPIDGRTYRIDHGELAEHIRLWAPRMAKLDPWSEAAFGEAYQNRHRDDAASMAETIRDEEPTVYAETVREPRRDDAVSAEAHAVRNAIRDILGDEPVPDEDRRSALVWDRSQTAGLTMETDDEPNLSTQERDEAFNEVLDLFLGERTSVTVKTEELMSRMFSKGLRPGQEPSVYSRIRAEIRKGRMRRTAHGEYRLSRRPGD